jgi:hypothetical protein
VGDDHVAADRLMELFAWLLMMKFSPVQAEAYIALNGMGRAYEYTCAAEIIDAESSWRPDARGDSGNSYGLAQRHAPAHGAPPEPWPVAEQIVWFTEYADSRYGGWCEASAERRRKGWW